MTVRAYSSPLAFKQALEQRLRTATGTGAELVRKRQLLVFDRFLARIVAVLGDAVTLKGGLALELRLERARTTKDVDLRLVGPPKNILEKLQQAFGVDVAFGDPMNGAPEVVVAADALAFAGIAPPTLASCTRNGIPSPALGSSRTDPASDSRGQIRWGS